MTVSSPANPPRTAAFRIAPEARSASRLASGLYLVATPIGNLGDVTLRALATLAGADYVLCEDTRVTMRLMRHYAITTRLKPYHDHNAAKVRPGVLSDLAAGAAVALVSDAGSPLISDPGWKLVREAKDHGLPVTVLPGASAPLAALAISGLPSDRFLFVGFLPAKAGPRHAMLDELAPVRATLVFFETAPRLLDTLEDLNARLGSRQVAVAREITKIHEEVLTGTPAELRDVIAERGGLKGEICLLVAPPLENEGAADPGAIDRLLLDAMSTMPPSKAAAQVARRTGAARQDIYRRALELQQLRKTEPGDAT